MLRQNRHLKKAHMIPVALIAGAALGAGQAIYGASQKKKAQAAAKANVMPEYNLAPEEAQMLAQAESQAGQGMSDPAREALRANNERILGTGIDAVLRGGGNPNAIGSMVGRAQAGNNQMALYEDQARIQALQRLQAARARMSSNRDKQYQINEYQPWANRAQAINEQLQGGQNMMMGGINTMSQGILGGLSNMGGGQGRTPSYIPTQETAGAAPIQPGSMQPQMYQPQPTGIPSFSPQGQPFGMMNEEIDRTPQFSQWGI